jgi:hypothetical protein
MRPAANSRLPRTSAKRTHPKTCPNHRGSDAIRVGPFSFGLRVHLNVAPTAIHIAILLSMIFRTVFN